MCCSGLQMLFEILCKCLVNLVQEQVWEQVLKIRWFKNPEQSRDQFCTVFASAGCLSTRCPVDSTRVLVWYRFYFLRFLLICHWESLNLTYTLKWFLFGKYSKAPSQNNSGNKVFRVFLSQNCKNVFHRFLLDFWANVSTFFKQDFLLIIWSKETIFGFEKLREDCKSIFSKLYSPSNKPSIFKKWLILWRKSWADVLRFCGWK